MQKLRLVHRLTLAMLVVLLGVMAMVGVSLYAGVARGFSRYVRGLEEARLVPAVRRLEALYARDGDFGAVAGYPRRFKRLLRREEDGEPLPRKEDAEPPEPPPGERPRPLRSTDPLELPPRVSLYDAGGVRLVGDGTPASDASHLPLVVEGRTVGVLGVRALPEQERLLQLPYARQVQGQLMGLAAGALVAGLLGGWWMARRLARPLEEMGRGARRLAQGDYGARVPVATGDELGQLARDINALAEALEADARSRRQWVADTSHELRTPLTVMRAELEALLDGVRPLSPEALESLRGEADRMARLVEDLEALARSDRGELRLQRESVDVVDALARSLEPFRARFAGRRITVSLQAEAPGARVSADALRLAQLFGNLLENSLRYTDEGGQLQLEVAREGGEVRIRFDDSAPGVSEEALPRLFERFFRAEPSRARAHGGSGLGLSICRGLVAAHGGRMAASASPLGGLRVEAWLPEERA